MIGKRLKELREERGKYQKEVAEFLHVDRSTYSKYEKDILKPSIEVLEKLSRYFNVSADYILGNIDEPITLDELEFLKELKLKSDDELLASSKYDFIDDSGKRMSKEDIKKMLEILRAYED